MADYSEMALVRGMSYLAEAQAAVAHNLANVNSTGFKRQISLASQEPSAFDTVLRDVLPTVRFSQETDWSGGTLTPTGEKLHVALEGQGFFMVEARDGQRFYTRNGALLLDAEGYLANATGHRILDQNGQAIGFRQATDVGSDAVVISADGTIRAGELVLGKLGVYQPPAEGGLTSAGQSLWIDPQNARPRPAAGTVVRQAHLESSNVESLNELVQMISVQRSFQATARTLSTLGRIQTAFINAVNR